MLYYGGPTCTQQCASALGTKVTQVVPNDLWDRHYPAAVAPSYTWLGEPQLHLGQQLLSHLMGIPAVQHNTAHTEYTAMVYKYTFHGLGMCWSTSMCLHNSLQSPLAPNHYCRTVHSTLQQALLAASAIVCIAACLRCVSKHLHCDKLTFHSVGSAHKTS